MKRHAAQTVTLLCVTLIAVASVAAIPCAAGSVDEKSPQKQQEPKDAEDASSNPDASEFLKPGTWWNFYFAQKSSSPLTTIHAVKVVAIHPDRCNWIQIRFPKTQDDHFSIFGPASKAHGNEAISMAKELAEWEKTIEEWETIWVNLDAVSHVSRVE